MRGTLEICDFITFNTEKIIENLNPESIAVYEFIQNEYAKGNLNANLIFQFVFRSYYKLDSAGLTDEFKQEYFEIFERSRINKSFDIEKIAHELYPIHNHKGSETVQFSFITKMAHTLDNSYPIYDNEVITVFGFSQPYYMKGFDNKIRKYWEQYQEIRQTYHEILSKKLLDTTIAEFNKTFPKHSLPEIMVLDFIFWSAGKLLNKNVYFEVKAEGGSLKIEKIIKNKQTKFQLYHIESDPIDNDIRIHKKTEYNSFEEAFAKIEKYALHKMHIDFIHIDVCGFVKSKIKNNRDNASFF